MSEDGEEEIPDSIGTYEGGRNELRERHGRGISTYANGDKYEGEYNNGLKEGRGKYIFAAVGNGQNAFYEGEWKTNKKSGHGIFVYPNGAKYEGEWKDDQRHGVGTYTYPNGDVYTGQWARGLKHGNGTYFSAQNNSKFHGHWCQGQFKSGLWKANNEMYKGEFKEDKPCGKGVFEFSSRNRQAGQFLMSQVPLIAEDPEAGMKTEVKWDGQNVVSHVIDDGTLPPGTDDDETLIYVANPVSFIQDRADRYGGIFRTKVFGSRAIGLAGPDKYEFVLDGKHFTRQGASPTHIQQLFGGTDKTPPIALAGPEQSVRKEQLVPAFNRPNTEKYMRMIDVITASHVPQWEQAGSFAFKEKLSGLFFEIAFKIFGGLYDEVSREHLRQLHETWSLGFTSPVKSDAFTAGLQARDELLSIFSFSLKAHSEGKTARWQPKPPEKPKETTDGEEEEAAAEQEGGLEDGTGPISEVDEEAVQKEAVEAEANGGSYGEIPPFGGEGLEPNGLVEPEFQPLVFDEQLPGQPPRDDAVFSLAQIAVKFGIPFEDMSLEMLYLVASCQGPLKVLCTDLFLALAQNPDVLEKAQREVRRVSASGPITIEQLNQIRYLEQVTHEVRRFYPTIPVQFFRTTQQVPIEDFRIPSGWLALAGVAAIHQDVSVWADPKKFDPERFTNEANSARRPFAYLPQGAGPIDVPQRPPSDDFTTIAMKVVAIHLLRKYDWQLDEEQPLELDFKKIIPAPTSGVLVKLERSAGTEEEEEEEQQNGDQ
mmetsp:Transcript_23918/g.40104  ORF Transcript_23918/g.40104 Transcript_23918/m.40104 type:complete len:763 (+) Transcript_23918:65-2353(+)|eukprot:CAMPEP_0184335508 /NCGR_PEP_ID=MMETSP1089-20130417/4066_1 /TAXON_ID=38269 ORGANISM="Gloeochaete wittrockiana, Strain SAG46.84" /NCGR_SAMPLE_ID=MMETSP1089 /ASSEMBLY_ACC=CAM_ASM_000445 /LENGTH=762 /DNA_ID=CAMNT_0026660203 /DNA_START=21 /DNA_END=2309 /DNA_ORIENTATION=-